jgi:Clustered mitochondria/Translation initiation factor eIF3 subunit 135
VAGAARELGKDDDAASPGVVTGQLGGQWSHVAQVAVADPVGRSHDIIVELVLRVSIDGEDAGPCNELSGRWCETMTPSMWKRCRRKVLRISLSEPVVSSGEQGAAARGLTSGPVALVVFDILPTQSDAAEQQDVMCARVRELTAIQRTRLAEAQASYGDAESWSESDESSSTDPLVEALTAGFADANVGAYLDSSQDDDDEDTYVGESSPRDTSELAYQDGELFDSEHQTPQGYSDASSSFEPPLAPAAPRKRLILNERFQRICELRKSMRGQAIDFETKWRLNEDLISVAAEFEDICRLYGRIICAERHLPLAEKTVKPSDVGGVAGGAKFVVQNVLFKFCDDGFNLYGSTAAASKPAGHDLRAMAYLFNHPLRGGASGVVRVPLAALLDFRGFRLVAMAMLPISSATIAYGSADGAGTIHTSDAEIYGEMESLAKSLNLETHTAGLPQDGFPRAQMRFCVDAEAHRGTDGRVYMVDFARVFPPTKPDRRVRAAQLVHVFRPEWVVSYEKALCSDGFSKFLAADPKQNEHNAVLERATEELMSRGVKCCAQRIEKVLELWSAASLGVRSFHRHVLVPTIHAAGVNIRLLGLIAGHCQSTAATHLLFSEMLARVLKKLMRQQLADVSVVGLSDSSLSLIVASFLNRVFGGVIDRKAVTRRRRGARHVTTMSGVGPSPVAKDNFERIDAREQAYDVDGVIARICEDYSVQAEKSGPLQSFVETILAPDYSRASHSAETGLDVSWRHLTLARFIELSGVTMSANALAYQTHCAGWLPLRSEDIDDIGERLKQVGVLAHAMAYTLKMRIWGAADAMNHREAFLEQRQCILKRALTSLWSALHSDPTSIVTLRNVAQLLVVRDVFSRGFCERVLLSRLPARMTDPGFFLSEFFYKLARRTAPNVSETVYQLGLLYLTVHDNYRALDALLVAAELAVDVPERSFILGSVLERSFDEGLERAWAPPLPWIASGDAVILARDLLAVLPEDESVGE